MSHYGLTFFFRLSSKEKGGGKGGEIHFCFAFEVPPFGRPLASSSNSLQFLPGKLHPL